MARFFQPIRGTEEKILAYPQSEGNFYVCTDTRKIYMDTKDGERIPIGGAGNSGIYYGLKTLTEEEKEATEVTFTVDDLELLKYEKEKLLSKQRNLLYLAQGAEVEMSIINLFILLLIMIRQI